MMFKNHCTCGANLYWKSETELERPHESWCPQREEFLAYVEAILRKAQQK